MTITNLTNYVHLSQRSSFSSEKNHIHDTGTNPSNVHVYLRNNDVNANIADIVKGDCT